MNVAAAILKFLGVRGLIAAAFAVALGWQTVQLWRAEAALEVANGALNAAAGEVKGLNDDLSAAVKSSQDWERVADERNTLLKACQTENARLNAANAEAIANARAAAQDAERTLAEFVNRYADAVRVTDCNAALNRLEAACPALLKF